MLKNTNVEIDMIIAFSKIVLDEKISDRIKDIRLTAISRLYDYLRTYEEWGYCEKIISGISEKKIKMIEKVTTKKEMDKIIIPNCPKYDGNKFIPDQYSVPEEELIGWSKASLIAPLNSIGIERYKEVFATVFPEMKI